MEMCGYEGASLQRGMNFRLGGKASVILMSLRAGAPYADRIENGGQVLIYEGHDIPRTKDGPDPKEVDQVDIFPTGTPTQNGLFWKAALSYKTKSAPPELVRVYEKIKTGIWAYAGLFELIDAQRQEEGGRKVFKFKLQLSKQQDYAPSSESTKEIEHDRLIPTHVKIEVWKRDKGKCVLCGNKENLHFDHIVPFSKGGTSLLAKNIQLLCAKHNLLKRDKIE
ncbi:MAG TPA: HNH endonuclease [Candidatus Dormibacteraeota bacterium]|nr:HNH endonuclease [Candidatus Dormibacteraeota bacterium]